MSVEHFNWYVDQIGKQKKSASFRDQFLCPCCFMPTLPERGAFLICPICFWEDDGQDSDDAEIVRGGPNGGYSLQEARENFQKHYTMYRPSGTHGFEHGKIRAEKVMPMYLAFKKAMESNLDSDWDDAINMKRIYYEREYGQE